MPSLLLFAEWGELCSFLRPLAKKHGLGVLAYGSSPRPLFGDLDSVPGVANEVFRLFLWPKVTVPAPDMDLNDVRPRDWGWLDVRPGACNESDRVLLMTQVFGDNGIFEGSDGAKFLRQLKAIIAKAASRGVTGRAVDGEQDIYPEVFWTAGAMELFAQGWKWKQFANALVTFSPS